MDNMNNIINNSITQIIAAPQPGPDNVQVSTAILRPKKLYAVFLVLHVSFMSDVCACFSAQIVSL